MHSIKSDENWIYISNPLSQLKLLILNLNLNYFSNCLLRFVIWLKKWIFYIKTVIDTKMNVKHIWSIAKVYKKCIMYNIVGTDFINGDEITQFDKLTNLKNQDLCKSIFNYIPQK